jgi:hypothetical protein
MSSHLNYEFRSPRVTMWELRQMAAGKGFGWSAPYILNWTN